jgi:outer membrane biosynthesis protein TonB
MNSHQHASVALALAGIAVLSVSLGSAARLAQTQPPQPTTTTQQPPAVPPSQPPPSPQPPPTPTPPPPSTPPPPTPTPAQPPVMPPPTDTAQAPATKTQPTGGASVLLDRITDLLDQALGQKPADKSSKDKSSKQGTPGAKGTSGTLKVGKAPAGSVVIERAALDEIRAEVDQLRIMLKDRQP